MSFAFFPVSATDMVALAHVVSICRCGDGTVRVETYEDHYMVCPPYSAAWLALFPDAAVPPADPVTAEVLAADSGD